VTERLCEFCPFVRSCPDCIYRGGTEPDTDQEDED
jgi:hypothetical protein